MFTFNTTGKIIFGNGSIKKLTDEILILKSRKPLFVLSMSFLSSAIFEQLKHDFSSKNLPFKIISGIEPDPSCETALKFSEQIKDVDLLIGIGGGSVLDITKVLSLGISDRESLDKTFGVDNASGKKYKTILIPTTAGTGSEVTPIAILSDYKEKLKKGIVSNFLFPDVAILDPELTLTTPSLVTAYTGMDALIHAMEAYTSRNANKQTDLYALQAIRIIAGNIIEVTENPYDISSREAMLLGSMFAGKAFANAGVTAVHAFAYPIGAEFKIPHGIANSIMLPYVFQYNRDFLPNRFNEINRILCNELKPFLTLNCNSEIETNIQALVHKLRISYRLSDYGVSSHNIPSLASSVLKVTRLLSNNYAEINQHVAEKIYEKAL